LLAAQPDSPDNAAPTPRQLLLKLLGSDKDEELDAAGAIRACALFGISANNARVALARLQTSGLIEAVGRGSYRLGADGLALAQEVRAWRTAEQSLRSWEGGWVAVLTATLGRSDRKELRARERALAMLGMQELDEGLYIRPDNFADGVPFIRDRLVSLGLDPKAPVFLATHLDEARETRARLLWDAHQLEQTYENGQRLMEKSLQRLRKLPLDEAAKEVYSLGDQILCQLVFDPMLPTPLVSVAMRQAFREAMRHYDEVGHQLWREFLSSATQ
jgi:phenylacetic acid degradation operon negative regulatory protein